MAMKHESRKRPAPASNVGGSGDSDSSSKSKRDKTADSLRLFDESLLKDVVQRKIDHMSLVVNFTGPGTFIEDLLRHKQDAVCCDCALCLFGLLDMPVTCWLGPFLCIFLYAVL